MYLNRYISLNIFSLIAYFLFALILFVFIIQIRINIIIISLELFLSIYSFLMYLAIFLLLVSLIERNFYKKYPQYMLLNKLKKTKIYLILFDIGYYFTLLNIIIFILIIIFLMSVKA